MSTAAYEALVREHGERLWRLAFRLTGDRTEAEDVTQEAFFEAWRSLATLRNPYAAGPWLSAILRHRAYRRVRTRRTSPAVERSVDEEIDAAPLGGLDLERLTRQEDLQRALTALDPERRLAFLMVFHEGFTCREAAQHLGVPLGTVLSRVHRARGELRRQLRRSGEERHQGHGGRERGEA